MGQYYCVGLRKENAKKWNVYFPDSVNESARLTVHAHIGNPFMKGIAYLLHKNPMRVIWEGDYDEEVNELKSCNLYKECEGVPLDAMIGMMHNGAVNDFPIVFNRTKNEYLDLRDCRTGADGVFYHPLALLCAASSNGDGGGDYFYNADIQLIGSWRYDVIETRTEKEFHRIFGRYSPKKIYPKFGDQEGANCD